MSQFFTALSYWLHSLATIVFIGYFLLLALIYQPVLLKTETIPNGGLALSQISKRSRYWMYASLLVFLITGILLMYLDPQYLGLGNFTNVWSFMMLVKHLMILVMVGMGFWFNFILRVGPMMNANPIPVASTARFRKYTNAMAITGVLVLLLTAIAQAA